MIALGDNHRLSTTLLESIMAIGPKNLDLLRFWQQIYKITNSLTIGIITGEAHDLRK